MQDWFTYADLSLPKRTKQIHLINIWLGKWMYYRLGKHRCGWQQRPENIQIKIYTGQELELLHLQGHSKTVRFQFKLNIRWGIFYTY
jgi:hypothetical protein